MTQEEYDKKYKEDNQDCNEIYNEKNKSKILFHSQGPNKIKNIDISENNLSPYKSINSYNYSNIYIKYRSPKLNNQNQKRNNLYHYKNDIIVNNLKQSNNSIVKNTEENNNGEIMQNPQQSFNPQYYKNSTEQTNNELNQERNNYINIENNSNEQPSPNIGYKYKPVSNNNYRGGISESDDKSSKLIGIENKYQKKIDELEQNILNNNNIDNYANIRKIIRVNTFIWR